MQLVGYLNPDSQVYRDLRELAPRIPGIAVTHLWLRGPLGSVAEPSVLAALHRLEQALNADPEVGTAIGPASLLRLIRHLDGRGDRWPETDEELEQLAADLEALLRSEPMLARFVQPRALSEAQITVVSQGGEYEAFQRLEAAILRHWQETLAAEPALGALKLELTGLNPLYARVAQQLVPTLAESFIVTVAIIFGAFLLLFRSGTARVMALIPSIFAILAMFGVMRLTGMNLNVATILVASTVLGSSENDQIHFFHHYLQRRRDGSVEQALRYTLRVAGRPIFYATLINATGFLAVAGNSNNAISEFGILTALAFAFSMIADFTALPAVLWILSRQRPQALYAPPSATPALSNSRELS